MQIGNYDFEIFSVWINSIRDWYNHSSLKDYKHFTAVTYKSHISQYISA